MYATLACLQHLALNALLYCKGAPSCGTPVILKAHKGLTASWEVGLRDATASCVLHV